MIFPHTILFWIYLIVGVISIIVTIIIGITLGLNAAFWILLTLGVATLFTSLLWIFFGGYRSQHDKNQINELRSQRSCPEFSTAVCGLDFDKVRASCQKYGTINRS